MLVQLNNGKVLSLDAVSTLEIKGTKVYYTLNNNVLLTEVFETEQEAIDRVKELFDFNYELDRSGFESALDVASRIKGE